VPLGSFWLLLQEHGFHISSAVFHTKIDYSLHPLSRAGFNLGNAQRATSFHASSSRLTSRVLPESFHDVVDEMDNEKVCNDDDAFSWSRNPWEISLETNVLSFVNSD
jgi:hypothetical protein